MDSHSRCVCIAISDVADWQHHRPGVELAARTVGGGQSAGGVLDNVQFSRVFEPFFRMRSSAPPGEGIGLGLTVCHWLIAAQGGAMFAEAASQIPRACEKSCNQREGGWQVAFAMLTHATVALARIDNRPIFGRHGLTQHAPRPHQVSMQGRFLCSRGAGGGVARRALLTQRRESRGSMTSSISKCEAVFTAFPRS